jgi:hypothetical protein
MREIRESALLTNLKQLLAVSFRAFRVFRSSPFPIIIIIIIAS